MAGTEFGELQLAIWKRQFEALRDGDRFFYENYPALASIRDEFGIDFKHSLAQIIAMNTGLEPDDLQENVFLTASEQGTERAAGTSEHQSAASASEEADEPGGTWSSPSAIPTINARQAFGLDRQRHRSVSRRPRRSL